MKNKYTLTIAGMEINVITDKDEDDVEYVVGMLDRKMRDIILKSKRCSKNEAALLCALDFCSDKVEMKAAYDSLSDEYESTSTALREANEKLDVYRKNSSRMEKEIDRLESENKQLRRIIEELKANGASVDLPETFNSENSESEDEQPKESAESNTDKNAKNTRNRVGSMFDLLTFSDI